MQPPVKPRRPLPDARALPVPREESVVPGIPKQTPSPRAVEAARDAARVSSHEIHHVKIEALEDRVDSLHGHLERVVNSVDTLTEKVSEWELKAAGGEAVKIQEEQKTKRWMAAIGVVTMVVAPLATAVTNYVTRESPKQAEPQVIKSAMELELDACSKAPSDQAWAECIRDASIRNAPQRRH